MSQWFLTLFSYSLRPPMLLRVLDLTFTDGWKAMFRFGLARLRSVEVRGMWPAQAKNSEGVPLVLVRWPCSATSRRGKCDWLKYVEP